METEKHEFTASDFGGGLDTPKKLKILNANRIKYEGEALYIRKKLGGLEGIQKTLNLSQRKICQLLMVDPSCWSRWRKDESKVPPSIWKALEWYLLLREKHPFWSEKEQLLAGNETKRVVLENPAQPSKRLIIALFLWAGILTLTTLFLFFTRR